MDIGGKLVELLCQDSNIFIDDFSRILAQLEEKHLGSRHSPSEFNRILSEICGTSNLRQMLVTAVCKVGAMTAEDGQLYIEQSKLDKDIWNMLSNACTTESQCHTVSTAKVKWKSRNRSNSLTELLQLDEGTLQEASNLYSAVSDDSYNDSFGDQINQFLDAHVSTKNPADEYTDDFEEPSPATPMATAEISAPNENSYVDDFEDSKEIAQDEEKMMLREAFPASSTSPSALLDTSLDFSVSLDPTAANGKNTTSAAPTSKEETSIDTSFASFAVMEKAWNNTKDNALTKPAPDAAHPPPTNTAEHSTVTFSTSQPVSPQPPVVESTSVPTDASKYTTPTSVNNNNSTTSKSAENETNDNASPVLPSNSETKEHDATRVVPDVTPPTAEKNSTTKDAPMIRPHSAAPQRSSANNPSVRPKSAVMHRSKSTNDTSTHTSRKAPLPSCFRTTSPTPHRQFHTDPPAPPPKPPVPVFRKPSAFVTKLKTITASKYDLNQIAAMQEEQPATIGTNKELFHYLERKVKYFEQVQPVVVQVWREKINDALELSIEQKINQQKEELAALKRQLDSRQLNPKLTQLINTAKELEHKYVPAFVKVPSPAEVNRAQHLLDKQKEFYFYDDKKTINLMMEKHRLEINELRHNAIKPQDAIDTMFTRQLDIIYSAYHRAQHAVDHADKLLQQHHQHPTNATLVRAHTAASDTTTILLSSLHHIETEINSLNTTIKALNSDSEVLPVTTPSPSRVDTTRPKSALLRKYKPPSPKRRPKSANPSSNRKDRDKKEDEEHGIYDDDFEGAVDEVSMHKKQSQECYSEDFDDIKEDNENEYYMSDDDSALMKGEAPSPTKPAPTVNKVKVAVKKKKKKLKAWNKECCSECRKRFRGKGKVIPTALKTKDGIWLETRKDENMFRGKQANYLSLLQTQQEPYGARIGADKIFCTWTCAKQWNNKHTSIQRRYETNTLIDIASGNFKNEF